MIHDRRDTFGGYLEDFVPGDVFKHWPGKTITEMDNHLFSLLTMNHNPLHIDERYMSELISTGRFWVNGALVLSLVVGMSVPEMSGKAIANLEYEKIVHTGPTFHGDTVYAESEILEVNESRSRPDRGIVYIETRAHNNREEQILTMRRRFLVPKRPD